MTNGFDETIDTSFHPGLRGDVLVILGHGVTGNKDRPLLVAIAEGLSDRGWPCLRISYSGNGESGGRFEDSNITKEIGDLSSVIDNVPPETKVVYIGHSMGGAVGVLSAAQDPRIVLLVTIAGLAHTADFVKREFGDVVPGEGCMWDEPEHPLSQAYVDDLTSLGDTLTAAASVTQPWLLIHGTADDVVPFQDGLDAYEKANSVKQWLAVPGAGHSFDETTYPLLIDTINVWLTQHLG
jgi:uncharacterized protein